MIMTVTMLMMGMVVMMMIMMMGMRMPLMRTVVRLLMMRMMMKMMMMLQSLCEQAFPSILVRRVRNEKARGTPCAARQDIGTALWSRFRTCRTTPIGLLLRLLQGLELGLLPLRHWQDIEDSALIG